MSKTRIFVVDDDKLQRWSLKEKLLTYDQYEVELFETAEDVMEGFSKEEVDLVIMDIGLPGINGLEALKRLHQIDSDLPVIMVTANDETATVVECMKHGAANYVCKPFDFEKLELVLRQASEGARLRREIIRLRQDQEAQHLSSIIGKSKAMTFFKGELAKVAQSNASTVLLQGENGTGKDLAAKTLHQLSQRRSQPYVAINCAALPESLIESELFGYERGAFTDAKTHRQGVFELAHGGTFLLDEIGEMPLSMQARLLRVLEERTFRRLGGTQDIHTDIRLIASTNRNLEQAVLEGRFRQDLLYRLKVIPLLIPPLREHPDDIPDLAEYFVAQYNSQFHRNVRGVHPETMKILQSYLWPGNIRELRNVIERAIILGNDTPITPERLPTELQNQGKPPPHGISGLFQLPPNGISLQEVEKAFVQQALNMAGFNKTRAAQLLGIERDALRRRIEKFELGNGPDE